MGDIGNKTIEQLRKENSRFKATMDALDAVVYVTDDTYELLYLNKLGKELTGDRIGEKCFSALQKGQTKPCDFCTNHLLLDQDGNPNKPYVWEFENTITGKWYQLSDQAILWPDGRIVRLEIATDISTRKQLEDGALEKEGLLSTMINSISNEFMLLNPEGIIIAANEGLAGVFGISTKDLVGRSPFDFMDDETKERRWGYIRKAIDKKAAICFDDSHKGINYESTISPIFNKAGKLDYLAIYTHNITDRKAAEQELIAEKDFSKKIVDTSSAIIIGLDKHHLIKLFNKGAETITGYTKEEVIDKDWFQVFFHKDKLEVMNKVWDESWGTPSHSYINPILIKSGEERTISWQTTGIYEGEDSSKHLLISIGDDISDQKQIEHALHENVKQMQSIFRVAPTGIGVVCDRVLIKVNARLCEMLNYSKDELLGENSRFLYPTQKEFEYVGKEKYRQIAKYGTGTVETKWKKKDGTIIDILLSSSPIDFSDLTEGVTFTALDITERKKVEEENRRSLEFQKIIASISSSFVGIVDMDKSINNLLKNIGEFCDASRSFIFQMENDGKAMSNTHEWCSEGVEPQIAFLQNQASDSIPRWMNKFNKKEAVHIQDVSKLPKEASVEKEILMSQRIKSVYVLPLMVSNKLYGFIGLDNVEKTNAWSDENIRMLTISTEILVNSIHSLNAEKELKASEEKFRSVLKSMDDIVFVLDKENRFISVNAESNSLLINPEEFLGKTHAEVMPKYINDLYNKALFNVKKGATEEYEYELNMPKGKIWYSLKLSPLLNNNVFAGAVAVIRDITERKESELEIRKNKEELTKMNSVLESLVKIEVEKNREKDRMMIVQSKQAAMGEMIGNIAHQWRQPLNEIGLYVQELQDSYEFNEFSEKKLNETVERTMSRLQYMSQTIDDFRNFFRSDKEKIKFSLSNSIGKAISLTAAEFKNNAIPIEVKLQEDLFYRGYPNEYSQAVLNILNNAKDILIHRKIKNPLVAITLSKKGDRNILKIFNNGGEIPIEIIDKIFEPYFTTKDKLTGTGLGLYISKTIIERNMSGKLSVKNMDGGVEFEIIV